MNRYEKIPKALGTTQSQNTPIEKKFGYSNTKYPEIPLAFSDIYVYVNKGDRYDILSNQYYQDSSLWWVIAIANPSQMLDSLIPTPGSQIRIPGKERISNILSGYENLNKVVEGNRDTSTY